VPYNNLVFTNLYLGDTGRRYRSLARITQPVVEPVSLRHLKAHLRIEHDEEDEYLTSLISAGRYYAEARCDRCFVDTQLEMQTDTFPAAIEFPLPMPPFSPTPGRQAIEVSYLNAGMVRLTMTETEPAITSNPGTFLAQRFSTPAVLTPAVNGYWPVTGPVRSAVTVRWWAGYGADATAVPKGIVHAILMLAAHWYNNREAVMTGSAVATATVPMGVDELLAVHGWGSYA
jgi:uncharacterized phiE125 gp8 family phage protein